MQPNKLKRAPEFGKAVRNTKTVRMREDALKVMIPQLTDQGWIVDSSEIDNSTIPTTVIYTLIKEQPNATT